VRRSIAFLLAVLALAPALTGTAGAQIGAVAYVQATIVEPNPAAASIGFVTASGRSRTARATGRALASLRNLRPGNEVILTLEGPADRPVATSVKVSRVAAPPPPPPPETLAGPYAWTQMVPSRPSWPNPYSRINPGLPGRPARAPRTRGGAPSVMPASLNAAGGGTPPQPLAAPALAPVPAAPAAAVPAVIAPASAAVNDEGTVEALRTRGARDFEAAVARLAAESRAVDAAYARFKASCPAMSPADAYGSRGWFALLDGAAVTAPCAPLLDEVRRLGAPIEAGMRAAQEAARRAWVLPGAMTEIRRRHSME
jgi:hypothetical protein